MAAIDELVDSSRMQRSQIVSWIAEVGRIASRVKQDVILIDDDGDDGDDSVWERADDDDDVGKGLVGEDVKGFSATTSSNSAKPHIGTQAEADHEVEYDSSESICLELGFEFGEPELFENKSTDDLPVVEMD
jgi:hypothetical protein